MKEKSSVAEVKRPVAILPVHNDVFSSWLGRIATTNESALTNEEQIIALMDLRALRALSCRAIARRATAEA